MNSLASSASQIAFLNMGQLVMNPQKHLKGVFLDVHPQTSANIKSKEDVLKGKKNNGLIYNTIRPVLVLQKLMGLLPIGKTKGSFKLSPIATIYSIIFFCALLTYVLYSQWNNEILYSSEAKFEDAAIEYLFFTHLVPIILIPVAWYESTKTARVFNLWTQFEKMYKAVNGKPMSLHVLNKPIFVAFFMVINGFGAMILIHWTMVPNFQIIQVLPYCLINTVTYSVGGFWYINCSTIASVSNIVSDDFQNILRHIGPSSKIAEYRALWLRLAKITRDTGVSQGYVIILLSLYLFLTITLSIYGLLSQIQSGLSVREVGLAVTAGTGILLLFFLCDEAHYCTQKVRDNFQKKLLTVELSWMNDDAQQELSMFIRATEMNATDLSVGGFFHVNRSLFKSLMATMVTYLVVLLQFQISIPTDGEKSRNNGTAKDLSGGL